MKRNYKWLAILGAFLIAFYMGSTIDVAPINNRAIVVGMAIDSADGDLEISAQILMTTASETNESGSKMISARSKTVAAALAQIAEYTSMQLSLAHCNFLVLGEELLKTNAFSALDYLVRNAYLSENALLTGAVGSAKEVLSSTVAFDQMSSFYAQRTLDTHADYDDVAVMTVKKFASERKKRNPSNYLTLIERLPLEKDSSETVTDENASPSAGGEGETEYYYSMTRTAVFLGDSMLGILEENETSGLNFALDEVNHGSIEFRGKDNRLIDLYIVKSSTSAVYDRDSSSVRYDVSISAILKEVESPSGLNEEFVITITDEEKKIAEAQVANNILSCYRKCLDLGIDIFDVSGAMYRLHRKEKTELSYDSVSVNVNIDVQ